MHTGREGVVRRLAFIYVIIWVNHALALTQFVARNYMSAVGYHLIYIHIALGAGTGLPDNQWKLIIEAAA